jgi:hypothetical protein
MRPHQARRRTACTSTARPATSLPT